MNLSAAIITKNEENNIHKCLKSLEGFHEIVIVDCGSSDDTLKIASSFNAIIFHKEWSDFSTQKQFAIDQCSNDWILVIDADECLPKKTVQEIILTINSNPTNKAYTFNRDNFLFNKKIYHGSWGKDKVTRLINKQFCHMSHRRVHEEIIVSGNIGRLQNPIYHWPRTNLTSFLKKANKYSTLGGQELFDKGKKISILTSFLHSLWSFSFNYIFRMGFLDGGPGLLIALSDAIDTFFKYGKCWELQINQGKGTP